jgi:hypothetical protein
MIHRRLPKISRRENTAMRVLPDRLVAILFSLAFAVVAPAAPVAAQSAPAAESAPSTAEPVPPVPAQTGLAAALAHFLEDDFSETDTGISEVARRRSARSVIIEALQDGRLRSAPNRRRSSTRTPPAS